jgi:ATP-binding cassette subfamily C protein CydC
VLLATHRLTPLAAADEVLLLGHDALAAPDAPAAVTARGTHETLRAHHREYSWSAAQEET